MPFLPLLKPVSPPIVRRTLATGLVATVGAIAVALGASGAQCQAASPSKPAASESSKSFSGLAHYYADRLHGKRTASGQVHDRDKMTAAHRSLPFGTRLKVTNKKNGKTCEVVVNDRGPFHPKFSLDLSQAAARELGYLSAGKGLLECVILDEKAIVDSIKHVARQATPKSAVAQEAPKVIPVTKTAPVVISPSPVASAHAPVVNTHAPVVSAHTPSALATFEIHTAHLPINDKLPMPLSESVFADGVASHVGHERAILNPSNEIADNVAVQKIVY